MPGRDCLMLRSQAFPPLRPAGSRRSDHSCKPADARAAVSQGGSKLHHWPLYLHRGDVQMWAPPCLLLTDLFYGRKIDAVG